MIITLKGCTATAFIGGLNFFKVSKGTVSGASVTIATSTINKDEATSTSAREIATVALNSNYENLVVTVTMGGTTVNWFANGKVTIPANTTVTGDIKISASATAINTGGGEVVEPEPENPSTGGESGSGTGSEVSLEEIQSSLKLWNGKSATGDVLDTITVPQTSIDNNSIKWNGTDKNSYALFSELPLYPGSEVSFTLYKVAVAGTENFAVGFDSDITGDWKQKNWKRDYTSLTIPESHIWAIFPNDNTKESKLTSLERLTNKFSAISVNTTLNDMNTTYNNTNAYGCTMKVLNDGFEIWINGNKSCTINSTTPNVKLSHTTTPVYFVFTTGTNCGILINSIKQVNPN